MNHHHDHGGDLPSGRRLTLSLLIPAVLLTALGMLLLWPGDLPTPAGGDGPVRAFGQVVEVEAQPCPPVPEGNPAASGCGVVTVQLDDGGEVTTDVPSGPGAVRSPWAT